MTTPPDQRPEADDDFFDDDDALELGNTTPLTGARGRQALRVGDGVGGRHSEPHARYAGVADDFAGVDSIDDLHHAARRSDRWDAAHPEVAGEVDEGDDDDWLKDGENSPADDARLPEGHVTRASHATRAHEPVPFTAAPALDDDRLDEGVGQLPAMLTCEAGRLMVSVREIRALQAGQVIDLGRPVLEGVSLMLDGREIARGMLVDLEGRFGVMLTALTEDAHHG